MFRAITLCIGLALACVSSVHAQTFTNNTAINIVDISTSAPYGTSINVSGVSGFAADVNLILHDIQHTFPDDIHIILESPSTALYVLGSAGGSEDFAGDIVFDDEAAGQVPDFGPRMGSSFNVSRYGTPATFDPPAPSVGFVNDMTIFEGLDPNGTWRLFVLDDSGGDVGQIEGGWSLEITAIPEPASALLLGLAGLAMLRRRRLA